MATRWATGGVAFLTVLACVLALRTEWTSPPEATAQEECREVETFTGEGITDSPPFEVTNDTWRISYEWESTDSQGGDVFQIYVYNATNDQIVDFISQEEPGSKTSVVNAGAGSYYLNMNTANARWTVMVEDCGSPTERTTSPPTTAPTTSPATTPATSPATSPPTATPTSPATSSPTASPTSSATSPPTATPSDDLPDSGGPPRGPVPLMADGSCPQEYPVERNGACYAR